MQSLPIDEVIPRVVASLRENNALVLVAPPGAGKTTRVPPAVLPVLVAQTPNLIMLQPRRVAARAAAQRIADEQGWRLGAQVGYHIRFDKTITQATRLRVLTEGILTRQLLTDPYLEQDRIGCVILDEFHERNLNTDLAIAMLREIQQTVRPDLKIIVMSATLEAEPVAKFLGNCPIIRSEGRMFPVAVSYAPASEMAMQDRIAREVENLLESGEQDAGVADGDATDPGDMLIFLPGAEEIRRTMRRLEPLAARESALLLPLHGSLTAEEQYRALAPAARRKIICATNIAETSLTIEGVRTVIDTGLARVAGLDPQRGLDKLELKRISRASATQRAGRAGRTTPGRCIRMWTAAEDRHLKEFEVPEIQRVDLCGTVLSIHAWGQSNPRAFGWYTPPPEETLLAAERLLGMLGALDADGKMTPMGQRLLALPVHPRIGRLLIAAGEEGMFEKGAALAAILSEKDMVSRPAHQAGSRGAALTTSASDLLLRLDLLEQARRGRFDRALENQGIDAIAARQVARTQEELLRLGSALRVPVSGQSSPREPEEVRLLKLPLYAYPDRVARRRTSDPSAAVMVGGIGLRLSPETSVHQSEFFLALDARHDARSRTREALVRIASGIEPAWLSEIFPEQMRQERAVEFDEAAGRVIPVARGFYRDLLLNEDRHGQLNSDQAAAVLAEAIRPRAAAIFAADERAASWLARLEILRAAMPEHAWPVMDEAALGEILAQAAPGKRSLADFASANLSALLAAQLEYPLNRLFEENAPETITVPTGNRIRIDYAKNQPPTLAVRLQELFGLTETPRIAGGRVPVLLHLLSPGYRPVQITNDLRSFWKTAYFEVRKDLRVRYPKHAWPEDPLTAAPVAKGRAHK